MKITPAHDPNDFEVGKRHDLPMIRVLTYDGHMTGAADKAAVDAEKAAGRAAADEPDVLDCGKYAGMTALEARKAILADLEACGALKETEPLTHDVGTCYRCHSVIEPMVSKQWFVKMEPLAKPAIESVEKGEIKFVPERFTKNYINWMKGGRDWCISRQLWWGHQIPAWYCDDCGETVVAKEAPCTCPKCGSTKLTQDPDTLDTWFSSALWPFSTLGWPNENAEDYNYFYPTNTLVTGYDIIGFWVSRMIFSGLAYTGKAPFDTVLIHFPGDDTPIIVGSALAALEAPDDLSDPAYKPIIELMDAVDEYIPTPERDDAKPFLMPIEDTMTISGRGTVVTGRVERGKLNVNEPVEIVGLSEEKLNTVVTGLEMFRKSLDFAEAGDNVGALLRGITRDQVERGQVLCKPGSIHPHTKFKGQVYVLKKEEGGRHTPFFNNYRPQFYFRTTDVTGIITLPADVEMCTPGDNVEMDVELIQPIAIEEGLRFAIREGGRTVGSGVVTAINE